MKLSFDQNPKNLLNSLRDKKSNHFNNYHAGELDESYYPLTFYPIGWCHFCQKIFKQIDQTILVLIELKRSGQISVADFNA